MALHWAWAFNISADNATYQANAWTLTHANINPNFSTSPFPRQPLSGVGGMTKGCQLPNYQYITTPPWPKGALSDGQIQFHFYNGFQDATYARIRLLASDGTVLLELRPSDYTAAPAIAVYSGQGSMTLRGTTTFTVAANSWHVLAIRFKVGTSGGEIAISLNGQSETIVSSGNVGATSSWARLQLVPWTAPMYFSGITVWDDGAGDDALTVTRWVAGLRPYQDDTAGSWSPSTGSDLYAMVDEDPMSTTDYDSTVTNPDEMRLKIRTSDISASWAPLTIDGVSLVAAMRGDGTLNTGQTVIDDGSNNLLGTAWTTTATSHFYETNDVFPTQADGVTPWTKSAVDSHSYGVKAS